VATAAPGPLALAAPVSGGFTVLAAAAAAANLPQDVLVVLDPAGGRVTHALWSAVPKPTFVGLGPDGRFLAAADVSRAAVYDLTTGRVVAGFPAEPNRSVRADFTPDGRRFVVLRSSTADRADGRVEVLDLVAGVTVGRELFNGYATQPPVFSPDGRWLAVGVRGLGATSEDRVVVCEMTAGGPRPAASVTGFADNAAPSVQGFSPDGRWLAVARSARKVALYEVGSWRPTHTLTTGLDGVWSVHFTPDRRRVMVYSCDYTNQQLRVWDLADGQEVLAVPCGQAVGQSLRVNPHFGDHRLTFGQVLPGGRVQVDALDGTPVPDELARERLGIGPSR
jgi:WD40 repeat protein